MTDLGKSSLQFDTKQLNCTTYLATVTVPASIVAIIYQQTLASQQLSVQAHGFVRGTIPLSYIEQNFKSSMVEHLKEFLFNYLVTSFLHTELRSRKLLIAGEPRIASIHVEPKEDAIFAFEVTVFPSIEIQEWKHLPFKSPKRKKYKDLDRQVDSFLKTEIESAQVFSNQSAQVGDWVNFEIKLVDGQGIPLLGGHTENLWFKMGDEEADKPLRDVFIGKIIGDVFTTANKSLQGYFSDQIDSNYIFCITIVDILHNAYFCIDLFKKYFKLKTNKEIYQKLIEVFSYRNDLSQRRSMAEESLKLILSKHKFDVPTHLVLRQQEKVMNAVQFNPDYHVYRIQKDFKKRVKQLAEKQVKEQLLLDQIAYAENLTVTNQEAKNYLNLLKRPRTKEFLYFDFPITKINGQEIPVSSEDLKQTCLREKTLNYIIYHLTRA